MILQSMKAALCFIARRRKKLLQLIKEHWIELIFTAVMLSAAAAVLWRYLINSPIDNWYEWAAVLAAFIPFCFIAAAFVFSWIASWKRPAAPCGTNREGVRRYVHIFIMMLAVHVIRMIAAYALHIIETGETLPFGEIFNVWSAPDTEHYVRIASNWYRGYAEDGVVWRLVFPPGYPILMRAAALGTGGYLYSGIAVSMLCSSAAGCVLYALARLDMDEAASLRAVKYFALIPAAFFYTAAMTEGLFMLLSFLSILGARRRNWLLAGLCGGLAAFTRTVGVILLAPVFLEWLTSVITERENAPRKSPWRGMAMLLIPAGLAAYLYINYAETGDPFTFIAYEKEHWFQSLGWFFDSPRYMLSMAVSYWQDGEHTYPMGLWLPSLISQFASLALMAVTARRQRPSYVLYFLAYFAVTMGAAWLLSAPRYLLVLFPLIFSLAELTKKRQVDAAVSITCTLLGAFYFLEYYKQYGVY